MSPLVVIPARKGSKRLPNKNILKLGGKPLIMHTVDFARNNFDDNQICISTDDERVIEIVEKNGLKVHFLRPEVYSTDTSSTRDVLLHASKFFSNILQYDHDTIILLQPTSPFRQSSDLIQGLKTYSEDESLEMVVSVRVTESNPYTMLFEETENGIIVRSKVSETGAIPKVYELNGSIYVIRKLCLFEKSITDFSKVGKIVMDDIRSIDIDTNIDWSIAEKYINHL